MLLVGKRVGSVDVLALGLVEGVVDGRPLGTVVDGAIDAEAHEGRSVGEVLGGVEGKIVGS